MKRMMFKHRLRMNCAGLVMKETHQFPVPYSSAGQIFSGHSQLLCVEDCVLLQWGRKCDDGVQNKSTSFAA